LKVNLFFSREIEELKQKLQSQQEKIRLNKPLVVPLLRIFASELLAEKNIKIGP
jgi:hypothetical protein